MIPDGWTDDGTILTAPNGVKIDTGMRAFIEARAWGANDVPLAPEYPTPTGSRLDTVYSSLVWNSTDHTIQFAELGKELAALKAQPPAGPPPPPEPIVPTIQSYTVAADDTSVQQIASKLNLGSWFSDLYQPNMDEIETAARGAGHPNSDYGAIVVAGTVLRYRA